MPPCPIDFEDLQTPVMPPLDLRFDPASRQYHRCDEPSQRDAIGKHDGEPAERRGAHRT